MLRSSPFPRSMFVEDAPVKRHETRACLFVAAMFVWFVALAGAIWIMILFGR